MLEYQKQDCDLTLQEGLSFTTAHFRIYGCIHGHSKSGTMMRDHDCTHVILV